MTNKNYAVQGSPYYRADSSIQICYNAATRAVRSFDALKKEHSGVAPCDRKLEFDKLYAASVDLCTEASKLRERVADAAHFEGIFLEGA